MINEETMMASYANELVKIIPHLSKENANEISTMMRDSMRKIVESEQIGNWTKQIYGQDSMKNRIILVISLNGEIGFDPRVNMEQREDGTYSFDGMILFRLLPTIEKLSKYNQKLRDRNY